MKKTYSKNQRIAALIGVILLAVLYLFTLIAAIFDFDGKGQLFRACLFATIGVPILIWIYIWLYGVVTGKKTITTVDFLNASAEGSLPDPDVSDDPEFGENTEEDT